MCPVELVCPVALLPINATTRAGEFSWHRLLYTPLQSLRQTITSAVIVTTSAVEVTTSAVVVTSSDVFAFFGRVDLLQKLIAGATRKELSRAQQQFEASVSASLRVHPLPPRSRRAQRKPDTPTQVNDTPPHILERPDGPPTEDCDYAAGALGVAVPSLTAPQSVQTSYGAPPVPARSWLA